MAHCRAMAAATLILCGAVGCGSDQTVNPSLPLSADDAKAMLAEMREDPKALARPVVVAGGIHDPGVVPPRIAATLRRVTGDDRIITVAFFGVAADTFDECRDHLIRKVEESFETDDPQWTVEVDVVAFSMGGLVARYAACPREDGGKRLNIRRLFTISAPHGGARWAEFPTWDKRKHDMRPDSPFLTDLDAELERAGYELLTYTRLGDSIVGSANAAPPGRTPWWVSTPPLAMAHLGAPHDPRIMTDIARRLRGEPPVATEPPAPFGATLPHHQEAAGKPPFDDSSPAPGT